MDARKRAIGRLFEVIGRRKAPIGRLIEAIGRPAGYGTRLWRYGLLAIGRGAIGAEHPREDKYAALCLLQKYTKSKVK